MELLLSDISARQLSASSIVHIV